jgi:hypothetical protein
MESEVQRMKIVLVSVDVQLPYYWTVLGVENVVF